MADTATGIAEQGYQVKVEDVGPSTKKLTIEVSGEYIAAKIAENFSTVQSQAALPGFRPGKVPAKLLEKRFGKDVREDVRRSLVSEAYQDAVKSNNLDVIGEPEFENPDQAKLPESGPMIVTIVAEIRPQFELPELKGIPVKKAKVSVTDAHLEQALKNLREQQGALVPVEDRGLEAKDYVTADVAFKFDGKELGVQKDAMFIVQPGRIGGIFIEDVDKQLAGVKTGETKTITTKAPEDHPQEQIRGKEVQIDITVKDIKKLEPAEINQEFLESLGFVNDAELREALKEQMEIRITNDIQQGMRDQVTKYLLEKVAMELPAKLSQRQTGLVIRRRAYDLLNRGMPAEQIDANIEKIKAGADEQAATELKSFFILDKVANLENVEVSEGELNGQIAYMAMQSGERPEKVKQQMSKDGSLATMYNRLRENKAIDAILANAAIEEVEVKEEEKKA